MLVLASLLYAEVAGITKDSALFTVQQFAGRHNVMDIGSSGVDAMDKAQCVVDANVHLHAELPFVALSGLVHLRIALARTVLCGAGRRDDGGINNAAFTQHQAVFLQVLVHLFEQHLAETMLLQKMTELKDRCFVWQTIELQASELAHGFDLVQCIFHGRIAEVIEQLHAVNAQHGRQRIGRPSVLALGVITGYLLFQLLPRNQLVHPFQKDLAAGFALFGLVLGFGEGDLIHGGNDPMRLTTAVLSLILGTYSESP